MPTMELKKGLELHGFEIREITPLEELNGTLYQLRHRRTGARLVHLATADDNNLFAVGFHTPPPDSTGVAHILEHTVLCGSRNFPVRDPFFSMLKRSLNTFMNALTSSDWTLYPFSSMNEKDYYNLMEIYLDAAFFPLLRERDFHQEGHRLEFTDPTDPSSPLVFKGVVYNEMKGAMADPSSLLSRRLNQALFPTTAYGQNSGGEPSDIPDLTWEGLRNFHSAYYHPANAFFFTSGNFTLERQLEKIEEKVLSRFQPREAAGAVSDEVRFSEPKRVTETFPVDPGEPLEKKSMVQVAWLTCPIADSFERISLSLLSTLLLGNPAAPLYQALMESRLGQNLAPFSGYHDDYRETYLAAGLQGTDPEAAEKVEKIVLSVLEESARKGFSKNKVEAAMQQLEFAHREVTGDQYPYALILLMRLIGPWIHNNDPVSPLRLSQDLDRIRREMEEGPFFENLIRKHLLENPHRVTLLLKPDPGRQEREEQETARRLEEIGKTLSEEEREQILRQTRELQAAQEAEEDLSCLPTLEIADIPAEERPVPSEASTAEGVDFRWFDQPTNGIGYFLVHLDAGHLPAELRPYVPLFCAVLTHMGAAGHTWQEMAERMAAATGGIRANAAILENPECLDGFGTLVEIRGKALVRNQDRMFEIFSDLFSAADFTDLARLHTVINQVKTNLDNSIPGSGHSYAARGAARGLTAGARLRDEWTGLSQIRFVRKVAALKPEELAETAEKLKTIGSMLLQREGIRCAVTAEKSSFPNIETALAPFLKALPAGEKASAPADVLFAPAPGHNGWASSLPVAYVTRVFRTVPFSHPDASALMVLARLLRAGFLHREIREKGGAYGGMATFDPEAGLFSLLSYRDPQVTRTLEVYRKAATWAAEENFSAEEIKEAILAVFSDLDRPLSPGGKGSREFAYLRQGLTPEMRRQLREGILAIDGEKISEVARRYLLEGWENSAVGVIAGEDALKKANEELGGEALEVERI